MSNVSFKTVGQPSFNPSINFRLYEFRSPGQQLKQRCPDLLLPRHPPLAPLGKYWGAPNQLRHIIPPGCPGSELGPLSIWTFQKTPPQGGVEEVFYADARMVKLLSLRLKEEASTQCRKLISGACICGSFGLYPQFMTVERAWNVNGLVWASLFGSTLFSPNRLVHTGLLQMLPQSTCRPIFFPCQFLNSHLKLAEKYPLQLLKMQGSITKCLDKCSVCSLFF